MQFSIHQDAIFDYITTNRKSSLIARATAGSGKSTTLIECASRLPAGLALAFNKAAVTHIGPKLPTTWLAKTFHGCAFAAVRSAFPRRELTTAGGKSHRDYAPIARIVGTSNSREIRELVQITDFAREIGVGLNIGPPNTTHTWEKLIMDRCQATPKKLDELLSKMPLIFHHSQYEQDEDIRFGDMIYWCLAHDLSLRQYKHILVDEAQDLSPPQIGFLKLISPPGGRIVAFGDEYQAIYGFRGSSANALDELADAFNADTLPLSTSYRCAKLIVENAQQYSPKMEADPFNPDGEVITIEDMELCPREFDYPIGRETAILCRNNAPIIRAALRFLAEGHQVQIRSNLQGTLNNLFRYELRAATTSSVDELLTRLDTYIQKEKTTAQDRRAKSRVSYLTDLNDGAEAIIKSLTSDGRTLDNLIGETLSALFDNERGMVFSTIHRAKGMEWDNVVFYEPDLIPSPRASTPEELQQEANLAFVVITRAKLSLTYWSDIE